MVRIAARFRGPPDSGNGGYSAGLLAEQLKRTTLAAPAGKDGSVEVTLRKPPPLERELQIVRAADELQLRDGEQLIAEARSAPLELEVPPAPPFERAAALSSHYVGHHRHHFPTCFVCGPARAVSDGLRIFPSAEQPGQPVAAPWVPDASLADGDGRVRPEFVWAALDCVGYFGVAAPDYPVALLGRITAELTGAVQAGERCVVLGWALGREGRKLHAGTAVFGADGRLRGRARQTWILLG